MVQWISRAVGMPKVVVGKISPPPDFKRLVGYSIASLSFIYYDHCWAQLRPVDQQGRRIVQRGCGQNLPSPLIRIGFVDIAGFAPQILFGHDVFCLTHAGWRSRF